MIYICEYHAAHSLHHLGFHDNLRIWEKAETDVSIGSDSETQGVKRIVHVFDEQLA